MWEAKEIEELRKRVSELEAKSQPVIAPFLPVYPSPWQLYGWPCPLCGTYGNHLCSGYRPMMGGSASTGL